LGIKNIALSWPPAQIHGSPKKNLGIHDQLHEFICAMAKAIGTRLLGFRPQAVRYLFSPIRSGLGKG